MKKLTKKELEVVLTKHKKWITNDEGGERADLTNADLTNADLINADLRYADLGNADLKYADLRNAKLRNDDLRYTDLRYTKLRNADLTNANLRYADLRFADLTNANLTNANLRYADLRNADLRNADLRNADLLNADLRFAYLSGSKITCNENLYMVKKISSVANIGSRDDTTMIFVTQCNNVIVKCGCFFDLLDKFREKVKETHKGTIYEKQYNAVISLAETFIDEEECNG